jgi:hypothetical protein
MVPEGLTIEMMALPLRTETVRTESFSKISVSFCFSASIVIINPIS